MKRVIITIVFGVTILLVVVSGALSLSRQLSDSPEKAASEWAQALKAGDAKGLAARTCSERQKAVPTLAKLTDVGVYSVGTLEPKNVVKRISEKGPTFRVERNNGSEAWLRPSGEYKYLVQGSGRQYEAIYKVDAPWKMKLEGFSMFARWKWCGSNALDAGVTTGFLPQVLLGGQKPVYLEY